ncbi:FAD-binding oxidoreductase [Piscicoccus intestinalis]|uniref:FAD-binding oxidoreductase n=1 Tax=Piscicoccus intestinalis TaxID=746033 RepID=UPI000AAE7EB0|nr:FAD-binding oxidoreductase [Piscicoccus intestinalis]
MALISRPVRRRPQAHPLVVRALDRLTQRSVALTLGVPPELAPRYVFRAGQHVTLRAQIGDQDVRRDYSICLSPRQAAQRGELRVASGLVDGGLMSTWLRERVAPGDEIEVVEPMGEFVLPGQDEAAPRHHVAIAAGSGITPVLSIVTAALERPGDTVTLVYGNRDRASVMFRDELAQLAHEHPGRLRVGYAYSREPGESDLLSGRLDDRRLAAVLAEFAPAGPTGRADEWYLCGPAGLVLAARHVLGELGADPAHVHHEVFYEPPAPDPTGS